MASPLTHAAIGTRRGNPRRRGRRILSPAPRRAANARHHEPYAPNPTPSRPDPSTPPRRVVLDDWVLCRIYNKKGVIERYDTVDDDDDAAAPAAADVKPAAVTAAAAKNPRSGRGGAAPMKVEMADYAGYYDDYDLETPSAGMLCFDRPTAAAPAVAPEAAKAVSPAADPDPDGDSANSMPWMHTDNSSCGSEHVLSPSPDLPDRDHAESQPGGGGGAGWWTGADWGTACVGAAVDDGFVVLDDGAALFGPPPSPGLFARVDAAAFADMLAYLQ